MPDHTSSAAPAGSADLAAAIKYFHDVEQKINMCMAGPDARDHALARLAQFGDPAALLATQS